MRIKLLAAVSAVGLLAMVGSASAAVTVSSTVVNQLNSFGGGALLDNFDGYVRPHFSFSGNIVATENPVSDAAAPPYTGPGDISICCQGGNYNADATHFESVEGGQSSTFSALDGRYLTAFSFYMGSPDDYNHVTFNFVGGAPAQTLNGVNIWGGGEFNGDRTKGFRVYYDFHSAHVSSIVFASDSNAFEADNFAGKVGGVPEPASWALMIVGFGMAGGLLRTKRRSALAA
jgi:hypothetical protein